MSGKFNIKTIVLYIFIFIVVIFMIISTYAYFNYKKPIDNNYEENKVSVIFNDNSSIAFVNAKKGDEINKTFTVKNISNETIYYDILFSDLVNNFNDSKDLIFSLIGSKDVAYIKNSYMPFSSGTIVSNIKLDANEEHQYSLNIKVESDSLSNTTFSTNVEIKESSDITSLEKGTLGYRILNDNKAYSEKEFDDEESLLYEGLYYTNNTYNGQTVYFFRGSSNLKNNLVIDKTCYRIIRTTEDNGIRIIYNGEYSEGVCNGNNNTISESVFNAKANYNAYVGYMYGIPNSNSYEKEHQNINSSKIKNVLDTYYSSNLNKYSSIIVNSKYCNNRKTVKFTYNKVGYSTSGYKRDNTGYEPMYRMINNVTSYKCSQENDMLYVDILSNPVGLLTSDEAIFAGIMDTRITDNYLNSKDGYWTMSPAYFNGSYAYNFIVKNGNLLPNNVSETYGVRPVITIKNDIKVKSGNGSSFLPYIVY